MIPGMNNKQVERMMKQMGIRQQEVEAVEVVIRCPDKEIIIQNPSVSKVNMMGQDTWQITGQSAERSVDSTPEISEEDVQTVIDQTGVSKEEAEKAISDSKGDLAEAIMNLQE